MIQISLPPDAEEGEKIDTVSFTDMPEKQLFHKHIERETTFMY
jgi:uncharacterized lipoprotein YbaY